jgi:hypothetical protein
MDEEKKPFFDESHRKRFKDGLVEFFFMFCKTAGAAAGAGLVAGIVAKTSNSSNVKKLK